MVNFRVENIEKTVAYLRKIGTEIIDEVTTYPYGKFVHILDPEGNAIELWEANDDFFSDLMGPTNKQIKKQAISRILSCLTIDLDPTLLRGSIRLPTSSRALLSNTGLLGVSPYRVYLISLQPNCTFFLLHWSYPLGGRRALPAILRYGVRTFLCTCAQR